MLFAFIYPLSSMYCKIFGRIPFAKVFGCLPISANLHAERNIMSGYVLPSPAIQRRFRCENWNPNSRDSHVESQSCLPLGGASDFHYRFLGRAPGRGCLMNSHGLKISDLIILYLKFPAGITPVRRTLYTKDIDISTVVCCFSRTQFHALCTDCAHCVPLCLSPIPGWPLTDSRATRASGWCSCTACVRSLRPPRGSWGFAVLLTGILGKPRGCNWENSMKDFLRGDWSWAIEHYNVLDINGRIV